MKKRKERRAKLLAILAAAAVAFTSVLPVYATDSVAADEGAAAETQAVTLEEQVTEFLSGIDTASSYNTVKGIYDKMKKELAYDAAGASDVSEILTQKTASSEGYAKTFDKLCESAKLKCLTVKGESGWWNLVQLDQKWYGVDVSADDQAGTSARFLVGTGTLIGDKTFGESYVGKVQDSETSTSVTVSEMKYGEAVVKEVIITPTVLSKTYGDADPVPEYICSEAGLVLSGALSRTAGEAVGTYPIGLGSLAVADSTKASSYKLTLAGSPVFTVSQRPLTVTDVTLQSESRPYDGTAVAALSSVTIGNQIAGDDVAVDMSKVQAVVTSPEAGSYSTMALYELYLIGSAAGNYSIAKQSVQKDFTITLTDGTEVGGEAPVLESTQTTLINAVNAANTEPSENSSSTESGSTETSPVGSEVSNPSTETPPVNSQTSSTTTAENTTSVGSEVSNSIQNTLSSDPSAENIVSSEVSSAAGSETGSGSEGSIASQAEKTALTVKVEPVTITYGDALPESYTYVLYQNGAEVSAEVKEQVNAVIGIQGGGKNADTYPFTVTSENEAYTLTLDSESASVLTVEPKKVQILFELPEGGSLSDGVFTIPYTGSMVSLSAYYIDINGNKVPAAVTYNNDSTLPYVVDTYSIAVKITDANYQINGDLPVTSLTITKKDIGVKNLTQSVTAGDTEQHKIALTEFGVPADAVGSVFVHQQVYSNGLILAEDSSIKDGYLHFTMREDAAVGKSVKIILKTHPNHPFYNEAEFFVTVTVEEMGYTTSVVGAPAKVTLGNDIALSDAFKLVITYDDGTKAEEKVTAAMLSGYDKSAVGTASVGEKTITVTSAAVEGASASFNITVEDVVVGLEVTAPDQLIYDRGDSRFDLDGGSVALKMRSGIAQTENALTRSMLSVGTSILKKVGKYPVDVTYRGYTDDDAFIFEVISDYGDDEIYFVDDVPSKEDFGMNLSQNDIVNGKDYDIEDLRLIISDDVDWDDVDEIEELVDDKDWDGYEVFEAFLLDEYGDPVELKRTVTLYLPYPDGVDPDDCVIGVYHKPGSRFRSEDITLTKKHIQVKIDSLSPFAVVWRYRLSSSSKDDDDDDDYEDSSLSEAVKHQQEMKAYWAEVVDELEDTRSGKTVTIDAGEYDYVPVSVLKAIQGRNITLKIRNDTTKTIVLNGRSLPVSSTIRTSYTMKQLYKAVNGSSSSSSGSSGTTSSGSSSSSSTLEDLWSSVVKSLKSYSSGTTVTINAKNNEKIPKTVLDAVRGKDITIKLKSDDYSTIVLKGDELPVTLKKKSSYTVEELYDAVTPPSAEKLEKQWEDVIDYLEDTKAGIAVTVNAGESVFIPDAVFEAIRGRNVTLKLKSDYYSGTVSVTGINMPAGLKGQKAYSIAQVMNRAKKVSSVGTITSVAEGNPTTGMEPVGTTGISSVMQQSSVAQNPVENVGQMSSSSSEAMVAPPIIDVPALEKEEEEQSVAPSIPSIESTEEARPVLSLEMIAAIGAGIVAVLIVILMFIFRGRRRRHRRS